MPQASELKRGMILLIDAAPCRLLEIQQQAPSARGANLMVKTRYRNLLTDQVLDKTFRGGDKTVLADFERRNGQYLYADGDSGVFMDLETYDQYTVGEELFGAVRGYLRDGTQVVLGLYEGRVVSIDPPQVVELTVVNTAPSIKGSTAQAQTKEAVLETGHTLQVPPYLSSGETIKVDTRDGHFISRA
ncbi:MAG: elongation factor P [Deferrisomatales bacterium]|nr:elongation factor P [Deferrisomatales bacterium]